MKKGENGILEVRNNGPSEPKELNQEVPESQCPGSLRVRHSCRTARYQFSGVIMSWKVSHQAKDQDISLCAKEV